MEILSPDDVLQLIDDWLIRRQERGSINLKEIQVNEGHINYVLRSADEARAKFYRGYESPSPLKIAACLAYAISQEHPLVLADSGTTVEQFLAIHKATALRNAEMGLDIGRNLASVATYNCNPEIEPPFDLEYPSSHFRLEVMRNLACNEINVPALAYIYELMLLHCEKGKNLAGSLDS